MYFGVQRSFGREHEERLRLSRRIKNQFDRAEPKHKEVLPQNLPLSSKDLSRVSTSSDFQEGERTAPWI